MILLISREGLARPIFSSFTELFERDELPFLDLSFFEAEVAAVSIYFSFWEIFLGVSIVSGSFFELKELSDFYFDFFSFDFYSCFLSSYISFSFRFIYSSYFF